MSDFVMICFDFLIVTVHYVDANASSHYEKRKNTSSFSIPYFVAPQEHLCPVTTFSVHAAESCTHLVVYSAG